MVKIIVDYRERKILEYINRLNCDTEINSLPVGDILILKKHNHIRINTRHSDLNGSAIIIERKSISDFINSLKSRRIWEQLFKLMNSQQIMGYRVDHKILVVQQTFDKYFAQIPWWNEERNLDKRNFWRYIINAIVDIIFVYQIPIIFLSTDEQLHEFLNILIKRDIKHWNAWTFESKRYNKRTRHQLPRKDNRLYLLCSLPSIGRTLSERLLGTFDSVVSITGASVKELQSVRGIGKKKAEIIFEIFHNKEIASKK